MIEKKHINKKWFDSKYKASSFFPAKKKKKFRFSNWFNSYLYLLYSHRHINNCSEVVLVFFESSGVTEKKYIKKVILCKGVIKQD